MPVNFQATYNQLATFLEGMGPSTTPQDIEDEKNMITKNDQENMNTADAMVEHLNAAKAADPEAASS